MNEIIVQLEQQHTIRDCNYDGTDPTAATLNKMLVKNWMLF